jgi:hypothetical protein
MAGGKNGLTGINIPYVSTLTMTGIPAYAVGMVTDGVSMYVSGFYSGVGLVKLGGQCPVYSNEGQASANLLIPM